LLALLATTFFSLGGGGQFDIPKLLTEYKVLLYILVGIIHPVSVFNYIDFSDN